VDEVLTKEDALKELKDKIVDIISIVKKNNNATFIGTIQTTEEVNRVSEKIILSKREKRDKIISLIEYDDASGNGTINEGNLNLLNELISICTNTKTKTKTYNNANDNYSLMSAKLYKCLYKIDETYKTSNISIPKDYKTMKEQDIDNMLKAIDTVLPIMKPYLNPQILDNIWKEVSTIERGSYFDAETNGRRTPKKTQTYPLENDKVRNISIKGHDSLYIILKKMLKKIKSNDKRPLLQFNTMLVNELKKEPSYNYLTRDVFSKEKKTQSFKKINYNTKLRVRVASPKGSLIKELTGNKEKNEYELRSPFYDKIYAALPTKRQGGGGRNASITVNSNSIIEKINGINYISPPPIGNNENVETSKEDLVKINEAVKRLRENIENMPSYAGNLEKLKEALQSLGATN